MEKNRVVDSSVFIAFYLVSDADHAKAAEVFSELENNRLYISMFTMQEVATVLTYKAGLATAELFIKTILGSDRVVVVSESYIDLCHYFLKLNKKISFADAAIIHLALAAKAELITFDRQMAKIYKKHAI